MSSYLVLNYLERSGLISSMLSLPDCLLGAHTLSLLMMPNCQKMIFGSLLSFDEAWHKPTCKIRYSVTIWNGSCHSFQTRLSTGYQHKFHGMFWAMLTNSAIHLTGSSLVTGCFKNVNENLPCRMGWRVRFIWRTPCRRFGESRCNPQLPHIDLLHRIFASNKQIPVIQHLTTKPRKTAFRTLSWKESSQVSVNRLTYIANW